MGLIVIVIVLIAILGVLSEAIRCNARRGFVAPCEGIDSFGLKRRWTPQVLVSGFEVV
jgi:hypothetical protein